MKITDYEKITQLVANNVLLVDGDGGTKTILARDLLAALVAVSSSQDYLSKMDISQLTQVSSVAKDDRLSEIEFGGLPTSIIGLTAAILPARQIIS